MADPCTDALVGKLVEKLVEFSMGAIRKQVSYLCCYSRNVKKLAGEVEELNNKHHTLQQRVNAALANSKVITPDVEAWLRKVEDLKTKSDTICSDAEEVKRSCACKWFPVLHYSLSRKALKTTNDSVELRNIEFPIISTSRIPADIPPVPTTSNVRFKSRDSIEDEIMNALKDPSVYSIGIWGIGGVGKTVMAKEIEKRVRDEKVFERVVMVVVSQQPDLPKIQSQIGSELGLILSEDSPASRPRKLHQRLMAEKDILIILDDLWERLDLEAFGIPSQSTHAGCKLILTSRNWDALTSTGVPDQNIFQLEILTEEESWRFFKDNAGIDADDDSQDELVQIAKKVERECMGLPLALKIVACALKGKSISFWNNAVRELEKHLPDNIPGVAKEVYGPLLYSINALEGNAQKDLFLLCCLFPEDYLISIEELLGCGMGLRIFKGLENLIVVRDKLEAILKILVSRSLLIEDRGYGENFRVRMHDVIRDVGIWIASEGGMDASNNKEKHNQFMISHGVNEWPMALMEEDSSYNYTCISLLFSHDRITFPESIIFPRLEFLRLELVESRSSGDCYVELPENFFNGMSGLRVLDALYIGLLPPSMGQLNNLCTLILEQCKIFETASVIGKLINLEILSLKFCEIEELPMEIGGLKKLKHMNVLRCGSLRRIAFGVVSGLVRLEELIILDSFDNWEAEAGGKGGGGGGKDDMACLSELNVLKNLTTLKIEISNPRVVPRQKPLWVQNLKRYDITVLKCSYYDSEKEKFQKCILLGREVENLLGDWIYDMASDAEYLNLEGFNCKRTVADKGSRSLNCLKRLKLFDFNNMRYLAYEDQQNIDAIFPKLESLDIQVSNSLQQICDVSPPTGSFVALQQLDLFGLSGLTCLWKFSTKQQLCLANLKTVKINICANLSYLFSLSVAQSLMQLTDLHLLDCPIMEEIFKKEDEGELMMEIEKIELPKLSSITLENLKSFRRFCNAGIDFEVPELLRLCFNDLPCMNTMAKGDDNQVHQQYLIPKVASINFNFRGLHSLELKGIGNFKCMFSFPIVSGVSNLSKLFVKDCAMLEQVIGKSIDENVGETIIFPNLKDLELLYLPNILNFCYNAIQLPSLERLRINECPMMLKFVEDFLDNHISDSIPFITKQVQCLKMKKLTLRKLNISGVFSPLSFKSFTSLEELHVEDCEKLEHVITKEGQTTTKMEEELHRVPLKRFTLIQLPKLHGSIFQQKYSIEFPSLEEIKIEGCPKLKKFSLKPLHFPNLKRVSGSLSAESAANCFFHKEEEVAGINFNFRGLHSLDLRGIGNFKCMFSFPIVSGFSNLSKLFVKDCAMLEQVIGKSIDENVGETIIFPNLKDLELSNLPNILNFCYNAVQLPSLERLHINECPMLLKFVEEFLDNHISDSIPFITKQVQCLKMKKLTLIKLNISGVFSPLSFKSFTSLEELHVEDCEKLEDVITKEGQTTTKMEEELHRVPLKSFSLIQLPKLHGSIFQQKYSIEFPSLEEIKIKGCPKLRKFSLKPLHFPNLKRVSGSLSTESAANFFFHKEEEVSKNNGFIIPVKDISFDIYDVVYFLARDSSESFVDAVSFPMYKDFEGMFKIGKIQTGKEYEIMLIIMLDKDERGYWSDPVELVIEVKLPGKSKLQRTEILENQPKERWFEISMGKFIREPHQYEQVEFSVGFPKSRSSSDQRLSIRGVRVMEV